MKTKFGITTGSFYFLHKSLCKREMLLSLAIVKHWRIHRPERKNKLIFNRFCELSQSWNGMNALTWELQGEDMMLNFQLDFHQQTFVHNILHQGVELSNFSFIAFPSFSLFLCFWKIKPTNCPLSSKCRNYKFWHCFTRAIELKHLIKDF